MKTFVRCTVVFLFVLGLSFQANAQSEKAEKDKRFKTLTQEQVDALTPQQISYLLENDIEIKVQDGSTDGGTKVLSHSAIEKMHSNRMSSDNTNTSFSNSQQTSKSLSMEEVRQMEIDAAQNAGNATPASDLAPGSNPQTVAPTRQPIQMTQAQLNAASQDVKADVQQNPENYLITNSNK